MLYVLSCALTVLIVWLGLGTNVKVKDLDLAHVCLVLSPKTQCLKKLDRSSSSSSLLKTEPALVRRVGQRELLLRL